MNIEQIVKDAFKEAAREILKGATIGSVKATKYQNPAIGKTRKVNFSEAAVILGIHPINVSHVLKNNGIKYKTVGVENLVNVIDLERLNRMEKRFNKTINVNVG